MFTGRFSLSEKRSSDPLGNRPHQLIPDSVLRKNSSGGGNLIRIQTHAESIRLFPMTKLWLQKPDIKKIVLIRDNALDIVISDQRARQSGQSHLNSGDRKTDFTVSLDLRSLERKLRSVEANNQRLYRFADQTNALLIKYEDILSNWNKTLSTLFDYLGVNPIALPPVLQKRSGIYLSPESVI